MINLIVKIIISLIALSILPNLAIEGRLTFAVAGVGMFSVAGRDIRYMAYAYRPNRTYWKLAITQAS